MNGRLGKPCNDGYEHQQAEPIHGVSFCEYLHRQLCACLEASPVDKLAGSLPERVGGWPGASVNFGLDCQLASSLVWVFWGLSLVLYGAGTVIHPQFTPRLAPVQIPSPMSAPSLPICLARSARSFITPLTMTSLATMSWLAGILEMSFYLSSRLDVGSQLPGDWPHAAISAACNPSAIAH